MVPLQEYLITHGINEGEIWQSPFLNLLILNIIFLTGKK